MEKVKDQFIQILGREAVLIEDEQVKEFHDPYEAKGSTEHQPSFVVQPSTVEEVQAVVKLANDLGIHLWTSSMGRNYGYGGSAPVVNGAVVLNLRRMNKILEINEEVGYALIEPGVSFFDLYNELKKRGSKLMMSVPDLGWGSIMGNALEHGYGYTVNGDNASAVCGLEVVLPTGEVLRTGQGAITNSPSWNSHKRGFGPSLDSIFMQSNFGVVTKMGIWLAPEPEVMTTGFVLYQGKDVSKLIDTLRPLMLDGTIQGYPLIVSNQYLNDKDDQSIDDPVYLAKRAKMIPLSPPARWSARIAFFGQEEMVKTRESIVREAISKLPDAILDVRTYPGNVPQEEVFPGDLVQAGIPNMLLMDMAKEAIGESLGHIDFSPVIPFSGEAASRHYNMYNEILAEAGLISLNGWIANSRSLVGVCMVFYDTNDTEELKAAHTAVRKMVEKAGEWGWSEYRSHPSLINHVTERFDFNDQILSKFYTRLKDAVDPNGILSPGNHGIWPSNYSDRK
jgi:4-cresol dehydrogenase (hydroxylating)